MLRIYTMAALVAAFLVAPAPAESADMADCPRPVERAFSHAFSKVERQFSGRPEGRDIRHRGVKFLGVKFAPVCHDLRRATRQLDRLLSPRAYLAVRPVAPSLPPAGVRTRSWTPIGLADCIAFHESGYDPLASNGTHFGVGQWTLEAWHRHGGGRFADHPFGASYQQQLVVLNDGLVKYGCDDWCPFDPC